MEILEAVTNGAQLLDEKIPGWAEEIDTDSFDLEGAQTCILGQLYVDDVVDPFSKLAGYHIGLRHLFPGGFGGRFEEAIAHGFTQTTDSDEIWEALTAAWLDAIAVRLN